MISSTKALCSFPSLYVQKRSIATLSNKTARLTQDGVFKTLFQDAANPSKLIHFLSAIAPEKKIRKLEFQDSYFPAYSRGEKDIYVDIVCKIWEENQTNPEIFVIEMQQADKKGVFKRWDFYASRCLGG